VSEHENTEPVEASTDLAEASEEVTGVPAGDGGTAAEKILRTLRELSKPDPDAGEKELMISSICMALERSLAGAAGPLAEQQASGELDEFVLALTRFFAGHRSESAPQLLVIEMPRRPLPAGTRLHLMDEAIRAAEDVESPL
jgi:hypothetical protein